MPDVICMGELLVEFVSDSENMSLADAPRFIKAPGGAPANVAVALKRLGLDSAFISKVGDDAFGEYLKQSLDQIGIDTRYLRVDPDVRTTAVFVGVWDDGRKDVCFYRNPGADMMLNESDIDESLFAQARAFHFGSISLINEPAASAQMRAIDLAKKNNLMISYDPNYRAPLWGNENKAAEVIQNAFQHCHLAKVSEEEWEIATGHEDLEEGIQAVLDHDVELMIISLGEKGAIATNGDYRIQLPAPTVQAIETTGAGDGFMAAFISCLLPERERLGSLTLIDQAVVKNALQFANAVGALTCTKMGAIPALPSLQEVKLFTQNLI